MTDSINMYEELRTMLCGERLGFGMSRETYVFAPDPSKVIKIETHARSFQNVAEWQFWDDMRETEAGKWLAPCYRISDCGVFLIQARVEPLRLFDLPKHMPSFLCDTKIGNYGMYDDRIVACDYGRCVYEFSLRLRKVDWRNTEGELID